jgi:hypothetical protein
MKLEDVASAVEAIEATGAVPSARKVRAHLGGGNLTQIAALLRELNGTKTGQAEVARLRRRVAELEAERARQDAALAATGAWALALYRDHVAAYPTLHTLPPPTPPRLVIARPG